MAKADVQDKAKAGPKMFRLILARGGRVPMDEWGDLARAAGYPRGGPDVGGYKNARQGGLKEEGGFITLTESGWAEVAEVFEKHLLRQQE